jgi:hypothetical protein
MDNPGTPISQTKKMMLSRANAAILLTTVIARYLIAK